MSISTLEAHVGGVNRLFPLPYPPNTLNSPRAKKPSSASDHPHYCEHLRLLARAGCILRFWGGTHMPAILRRSLKLTLAAAIALIPAYLPVYAQSTGQDPQPPATMQQPTDAPKPDATKTDSTTSESTKQDPSQPVKQKQDVKKPTQE